MKIEPLDDRIVVEQMEAEEVTKGGIVLPDTAKEKPQQGRVVAAGPGRMLDTGERAKPAVKPGDVVVYAKYGGTEVEVDDKEYMILRESDVLAKVEGGAKKLAKKPAKKGRKK
jgi:chaperonin GroES